MSYLAIPDAAFRIYAQGASPYVGLGVDTIEVIGNIYEKPELSCAIRRHFSRLMETRDVL